MTIGRVVVALSLVAAVTAWVVASGGAPPPRPAPSPDTERIDAEVARALDVLSHADRLHARLAAMPPRPGGVRNPFRFTTQRRPEAHRATNTALMDPIATDAADAPPPRPELRLIGIAEDARDGASERTAVVTGLNQLYLVREGEQIAMRFLVKRIGADAIEVEDLADSTPLRLGLR